MSAFQIGVECTSQVSSWRFRPPPKPARRPKWQFSRFFREIKQEKRFFFSLLSFLSCCLWFTLALFLPKPETVAPEIGHRGGKSRRNESMYIRRPFSEYLSVKTLIDLSALYKVTWQKCTFRKLFDWEAARWRLFYLKASGEFQWHLQIHTIVFPSHWNLFETSDVNRKCSSSAWDMSNMNMLYMIYMY